MSKRYSARKVKRSAVRWMRATTTYYLNFPTIGASSFTSSVIPIAVNYKRTDFDGAPSASNVANITVKNFHVEFNLPDCNIGESYLCQLAFVPNGLNPTVDNGNTNSIGSGCYSFTNPDYTLAEKQVIVNDYDTSRVVLSTKLARKLGPNDRICLLIHHINHSSGATSGGGYVTIFSSYFVKAN